jgi:dTDP-3-amino-3,4,6-trideoxy-alpha-D-glucose transaminase
MIRIPFIDLSRIHATIRPELDDAYQRIMASGWYVLGPELEQFEQEFARFCGVGHCVGVGNGLDALRMTLAALDVGPGDEVIVPGHTFIATWLAVTQCGATPVPVDINANFYNIDAELIEQAINPRTRAIVPVHLYGQPADLGAINDIAQRHGLAVVEDAAQAHGANYQGRPIGSLSDAATFSFYPAKNLGALGDGGAVVTHNAALAERIRKLRNYGSSTKYQHDLPGNNSRLDELQAAFLRVQLHHLPKWNRARQVTADHYLSRLQGLDSLKLPDTAASCQSVWHQFVIRHPERNRLHAELKKHGIQTLIHYPIPPHQSNVYHNQLHREVKLPVTEAVCAEVLSLPISPCIRRDELDAVCEALGNLIKPS